MYWGFGCCLGSLEKWKVRPRWCSAGIAQNTTLDMAGTAGSFGGIWYLIPSGIEFAN